MSARSRANSFWKELKRALVGAFEREGASPHQCPDCGCITEATSISRTIDVMCPHCGAIFNSFSHVVIQPGDPNIRCR